MANGNQFNQSGLQLAPSGQTQRRNQLGEALLSQGMSSQPVQGGLVEALSRIGQSYFGNQIVEQAQGEQQDRQRRLAETLQNATQATQPGATAQNPMVGPTQMSDSQRMAAILGQNPDTAPMALQLSMDEATREPQAQRQTVTGDVANRLLGTNYSPNANITLESGPQGTAVTRVDEPREPDREDYDATNVALPDGSRVRGRKSDRGELQVMSEDGQWQTAPRGSQIIGTSITGSADEVGLGDTEKRKLNDLEAGTRDYIATTRDAIQLLDEQPDVNTWTARGASLVNSLQQEAKALGRQFGTDFNPDNLNPSKYKDEYEDLGIQSNRVQSMVQSLAYQLARTREGGRLSDADIRNAIRTVGASSSDPESLKATMRDVADRTARRFRINYEVRTEQPFQGDLGLESLTPQEPRGQPGPTRERAGEVEIDAETQRLLEKYP